MNFLISALFKTIRFESTFWQVFGIQLSRKSQVLATHTSIL